MERIKLKAEERSKDLKAKTLRRQGKIPCVIYNHGKTDHIQISEKALNKVFAESGVSESLLFDIDRNGEEEAAYIKAYDIHPLTGNIEHLDFYRITFGEKIVTNIPIKLEGSPVGVKEGGALEVFRHEVEVQILPKDLVREIVVNIDDLKIGDAIHLHDVPLPGEAELMAEGNPTVCHIALTAKLKGDEETEEDEALEAEEPADEKTEEG